jgi:hypothetical protein
MTPSSVAFVSTRDYDNCDVSRQINNRSIRA